MLIYVFSVSSKEKLLHLFMLSSNSRRKYFFTVGIGIIWKGNCIEVGCRGSKES